jgi:hypothetical protein
VAVSRNGQLLPEVKDIISIIAKNNLVLASGHVVPEDALLAFREAKAAGVKLLIATHAADPGSGQTGCKIACDVDVTTHVARA